MRDVINRRAVIKTGAAVLTMPMLARRGLAATPLAALFDDFVARERFAGVIATARAGRLRSSRAFGLADVASHRAATVATPYALGSASNWLTTVGVLRLVDEGRLDLDAPITRYLTRYRADTGARVLVRHLLSNTSGIPDRLSPAAAADPALRTSTASAPAMIARFGEGDLAFAPGARFDYSLMNWVILRALLEERSGMDFVTLMGALVIGPLGLRRTGIAEHGFGAVPTLARAYTHDDPPARKSDTIPGFAAAAGSFYADAADCARAAHAIFRSSFLSARSRAALTTVQVPDEAYALGGRIKVIGGRRWGWEAGRTSGYRSLVAQDLATDDAIIMLCNNDVDETAIGAFVERVATI